MASPSRNELLRRSWSQIAEQYEKHLVPRFMPWTEYTLEKFSSHNLPPGPVLVPACGPGHELVMLAKKLPDKREIIGIDIASDMVDLANQRCAAAGISDRAGAESGDAGDVAASHAGAAGIVSLFGLQQLPHPHLALANWVQALAPGGVLAVTYWPAEVEQEGPWQRLASLTTNKPKPKQPHSTSQAVNWEELVPELALRKGAHCITDEKPSYMMRWSSMEEFWEVMTEAGPWHSRRLLFGEEYMYRLKEDFMSAYPSASSSPVEHRPCARLLVIQKNAAAL